MMDQEQRTLSAAQRLDWLRLYRSDNVGPIAFRQLLRTYGSAADALAALPELAKRGGRKRPLRVCPKATAEREIEALDALGGHLIACCEPGFPAGLAALEESPPLISYLGHGHLLQKPAVAIVGARNASGNGRKFARTLAAGLVEHSFLVVSGMARGIDTAAHQGAMEKATAAVVAGGLDVVYPAENQALYENIVAAGLVISEMPPGTRPQARHFPRRNRIISGLSLGVVVVEAAPRSGSLITARLAGEQGRDVFAVPGSPLDPRAKGCNQLIRQGAVLVEGVEDIVEALASTRIKPFGEDDTSRFRAGRMDVPPESELAAGRRLLEELLSPSAVPVDELIRQCQLSPAIVSTILLELELAGRIKRHAGNRVALDFEGSDDSD